MPPTMGRGEASLTGLELEMSSVVVVGSISADLVAEISHAPGPGETVLTERFSLMPGGKGANQACAAAMLGAEVLMVGCVGEDVFADMQVVALEQAGVDTKHVSHISGATTGTAIVMVESSGQNRIVVSPGANFALDTSTVEGSREAIESAGTLVLQEEIPLESIVRAAALGRERGARVILNPAPSVHPLNALPVVDLLVCNEVEANQLSGVNIHDSASALEAARVLRTVGFGSVVVTLGAQGAVASADGIAEVVPAPLVETLDTTGAGDAFIGGLVWALDAGQSLVDAVELGCKIGAFAVTSVGARPALPRGRVFTES